MNQLSALYHVVYISQATAPFGSTQLRTLLAGSRLRNAARSITGLLLCGNDQFFQVLEGEPATVQTLYQRICRDPRHLDVVTLANRPITRRRFVDWSMGLLPLPAQQFIEFTGYATQASQHPDPAEADQQLAQLLATVLAEAP